MVIRVALFYKMRFQRGCVYGAGYTILCRYPGTYLTSTRAHTRVKALSLRCSTRVSQSVYPTNKTPLNKFANHKEDTFFFISFERCFFSADTAESPPHHPVHIPKTKTKDTLPGVQQSILYCTQLVRPGNGRGVDGYF